MKKMVIKLRVKKELAWYLLGGDYVGREEYVQWVYEKKIMVYGVVKRFKRCECIGMGSNEV